MFKTTDICFIPQMAPCEALKPILVLSVTLHTRPILFQFNHFSIQSRYLVLVVADGTVFRCVTPE